MVQNMMQSVQGVQNMMRPNITNGLYPFVHGNNAPVQDLAIPSGKVELRVCKYLAIKERSLQSSNCDSGSSRSWSSYRPRKIKPQKHQLHRREPSSMSDVESSSGSEDVSDTDNIASCMTSYLEKHTSMT